MPQLRRNQLGIKKWVYKGLRGRGGAGLKGRRMIFNNTQLHVHVVYVHIHMYMLYNVFVHVFQATTPSNTRWDETPGHVTKGSETPGVTPSQRMWEATPSHTPGHMTPATPGKRNRWDETPKWGETPKTDSGETSGYGSGSGWGETPKVDRTAETPTPHGGKRRSRWDETPSSQRIGSVSTPMMGGTPMMGQTPNFSAPTPAGSLAMGLQTPSAGIGMHVQCICICTLVNFINNF